MKQHPSYMDGESWDLLLFDYLEGNLTEARAQELEMALATDPALRAELESWKESFVVQEFYPTGALEEQLLQVVPKPFSFSGPAAGFMLVLLTSLFSFLPIEDQAENKVFSKAAIVIALPPVGDNTKEQEVVEPEKKPKPAQASVQLASSIPATATGAEAQMALEPVDAAVLPLISGRVPEELVPLQEKNIPTVTVKKVNGNLLRPGVEIKCFRGIDPNGVNVTFQ